jgi:hypothetical protein
MRIRGRHLLCAALLLAATPVPGHAQVFMASRPHPDFAIGPLFVVATVHPDLGPVNVSLSFSLTTPQGQQAADIKQDLFLLWPAELGDATAPGSPDPALVREVQERGFVVHSGGRLMLGSRQRMQLGTGVPPARLPEAASFVTFTRQGGAAAQVGPSTYIKIPWNPSLADPAGVTVLTLASRGLVTPKPATWFEELFWGRRWVLNAGFGDIGSPVMPGFPLYFEQRDRVVRLGREYSIVVASFSDSDHLRIEEIGPASATRRPSRLRAGIENVTMPLGPTEGVMPQMVKVQFSYFAGAIAWRPIGVSLVLLALGNLAGFIFLSRDVGRLLRRRLHVRRREEPEFSRLHGPPLPRAVAEEIVPGRTTESEVLQRCGPPDEERNRRGPGAQRALIYRATRRLPRTRRALGRLTTVDHWEEELYEMEIEVEAGRVSSVESRIRRARAAG